VGRAYKKLIADWRELLPAFSHCLVVPVVPPSRSHREYAREQQQAAAGRLRLFVNESDADANAGPFSGGGL
jgi:hypothetical protein